MNIQNVSIALFNKLRGQFPSITVGDDDGNVTNDPKQARFFDFDYTKEGKSFGKISISISEDQGLVVLHSNDIIREADPSTKASWYNFLKQLREFAKSRLMGFDTRDITKSNLEKRDYEFLTKEKNMASVSESNMFGTNKTSFQQIGDAKLIVKHSTVVNPAVPGARSQKIESIFIESPDGEKFKFPLKHLNGARAMTRHIAEGGNPYDNFGKYIISLSEELNKLRKFKTYMNRSNVMAEGLKDYLVVVDERIEEIKNTAQKLQKQAGYKSIKENYSDTVLEEVPEEIQKSWIDELTIRQFNEELKDVFPYIYKLISEKTSIKNLTPEDFETETHGYQGSAESRTLKFDVAGDFDPERPVSEKDAEEISQELGKAGIVGTVRPDENKYNGIIIYTNANPEAVKDALGSMIESLNTFEEFEKTLESIVSENQNSLFSSDKEESNQAVDKLNTLMAKHFPAGVNGVNGIESLQGIIDDVALNNLIKTAAKEDSDICIRPMIVDYIKSKKPEMISKIDIGDMKTEAITFEDIKPYVSMHKSEDGKMMYDVLNKAGESVETFKDAKSAMTYLITNFNALKNKDVKENQKVYDGSFEYELYGDDGETAYGKIHYKAVNGRVDPKSLQGEYEYEGNAKVDSDLATQMIQPGGDEHDEALKAAQEDYDYEAKNKKESQVNIDDEYRFRDWLKKTHNKELHQLTPQEYMAVSKQYRDETGKKESNHPGEESAEELAQTMWNNNPSLHDEFKDWQEYMNSEEFQMDVDKLRSKFESTGGGANIRQMSDLELANFLHTTVSEIKKDREAAEEAAMELNQKYASDNESAKQKNNKIDENMSRQHFQYVADTLKDIQDPIKRAEYAKHHSAIFQHFNPRFDHAKFMAAVGVEIKKPVEDVSQTKDNAGFTDKQIKMAYGVLNDPKYRQGNYDGAVKVINKIAPGLANHPNVANALKRANEGNDLQNKANTVAEFVKSFFDYTTNQFPKGKTAVLTSVEKKFGDSAVSTAEETIQKLMANKDPHIAKIKKLAGL